MILTPDPERKARHYSEGFWKFESIYDLVAKWAEVAPRSWAIRDRYRRINYKTLISFADNVAADLKNKGLKPGDRIAVWLPSRVETAAVLLACSRDGYICCPGFQRGHTIEQTLDLLQWISAAVLIFENGYGSNNINSDIESEWQDMIIDKNE